MPGTPAKVGAQAGERAVILVPVFREALFVVVGQLAVDEGFEDVG